VLAALIVLLAVEVVVDKIAGADHVNDAVQTFVRPATGAALMLLTTDEELSRLGDVLLGGGLAGGVHAAKAAGRGAVSLSTLGLGNPVVSTIEDVVAALSSVVAIAIPALVLLVIPAIATLLAWLIWRRRRRPAGGPAA
jgi:hypothetical protein